MSQTKHNQSVKLHVRKGDRVKVIAGKDKGLVGEVIAVYPERSKVTVAGVNIVKRHLKDTVGPAAGAGRPPRAGSSPPRRRSTRPTSSWSSRTTAGDEVVTRVGYDRVEVTKRRPDGIEYKSTRSVRIARVTGEEI